jgi:hypothetical protein
MQVTAFLIKNLVIQNTIMRLKQKKSLVGAIESAKAAHRFLVYAYQ